MAVRSVPVYPPYRQSVRGRFRVAMIVDDPDVAAVRVPGGVVLVARFGHPRMGSLPRMDAHGAAALVAGALRYDGGVGQTDVWAIPKLRRLLEQSHTPIQPFLPAVEGYAEALERALRSGFLIAVRLTAFDLGRLDPDAKVDATGLPASTVDRIKELFRRTPKYLSDDLAAAFRKLISAEALAALAAAFAILLAAQFFGVGEFADAALAWWACTQAGFSGVYGLYAALRAVVRAVRAKDDATFDQAVGQFADGIALVGVALLTAVLTKVARAQKSRGASGGANDGPSTSSAAPAGQSPTSQFSRIGSTGRVGENALKELGGRSQVYFKTSLSARYVDQFVDGVANESKVGYQTLTESNQLQALKDSELIETGRIDGSVWHFFTSPVTGEGGPSAPLADFLTQHGITSVTH